jgi:alkylated DNA repair dioxygenase AlkB
MQEPLFRPPSKKDYCIEHQLGDASISEFPNAFDREEADSLLQSLLNKIQWQQDYLKIAGKTVAVPRLQCWMGDKESNYGYSGIRLEPVAWQNDVQIIRERVETFCGRRFNSVLLNYYRNGNDSVAWHADDEVELGKNPIIASVSFGSERSFQLKPKHAANHTTKKGKFSMVLGHGSLIVMGAGLQENWIHQIAKVKDLLEPRINLTFRNIIGRC